MIRLGLALLLALGAATAVAAPVPPRAERGRAGAACRANEPGPAYRVEVRGLKDRQGVIRLELYPDNDREFLAPDRDLIARDRPFLRVEHALPATGPVVLCIRAPGAGRWSLAVLHDRDGDGRFGFLRDGAGFPNNPPLRRAKPAAAAASLPVGQGIVSTTVVMNYRRGFGFGPLD